VQLNVNKSANPNLSYEFDLDELRKCLDDGYPFAFGCTAFNDSIPTFTRDGTLEAPGERADDDSWFGHALMGVGYDNNTQCFIIQNSWGPRWNNNGCFMMSYDIIAHPRIAYDFWSIRAVKIEGGGGEEEEKAEEKQEENKKEKEKEKEW
jgi:C1A family cysteine protease